MMERNRIKKSQTNGRQVIHRDQLITVGDLEELKSDLLRSIQAMVSGLKGQVGKKWLKSYEVKKLLNVSNGTLQTLRSNGTLPFTRIGGTIYYDSEDIDRMLIERKSKIPSQPALIRKF